MELPTSLDQPLQGHIVCACSDMFLPVFAPRDREREREPLVIAKASGTSTLFASSFNEIYNSTKHHTRSAVARVTNDRTARAHLPSTVENQQEEKEKDNY